MLQAMLFINSPGHNADNEVVSKSCAFSPSNYHFVSCLNGAGSVGPVEYILDVASYPNWKTFRKEWIYPYCNGSDINPDHVSFSHCSDGNGCMLKQRLLIILLFLMLTTT